MHLKILVAVFLVSLFCPCLCLDEWLPSTVQVILLVHPYNKVKVLPFSLGSLESQEYSSSRVNVFIRTEIVEFDEQYIDEEMSEKLKNNQLTIDMIKKWIRVNRDRYNDVELVLGSVDADEEAGDNYWTYERYKKIINMKEEAFKIARRNWADFIVFMDADVILTDPKTFVSLTNATEKIVIAPMLYSLGTYSNFWAGMTKNGYYKRTEEYLPILEREQVGQFAVPMVHSCVFINLRSKLSELLTFDSRKLQSDLPFDDIIAFAKSAEEISLKLYIDNQQVWGYIPPPMEVTKMPLIEQNLIDLELESLIEGPSFPIADSLATVVLQPPKDKLNADNVYMINLVRRPKRKSRMMKCFDLLGIEVQIWSAVDGKELSVDAIKSKVMEGYLDPYHKRPMTYGEIGCFLSHYQIWRDILQRNLSNAIIFEDDVRFERNFKNRWAKAFQELPEDVDLVYLGRKPQGSEESRFNEFFVKPNYSYWTIGYFITQKGARKLIDSNPLDKLIPVDEFLPVMYDKHPTQEIWRHFPERDLIVLSVDPLLIFPTHYVGDDAYFSDTEDSTKIDNHQLIHPKHSEL